VLKGLSRATVTVGMSSIIVGDESSTQVVLNSSNLVPHFDVPHFLHYG
jgi:hypothetical protein